MASLEQIMQEVQAWAVSNPGLNPFDGVRREKLNALKAVTGRPVLLYATDFFNPKLPAGGPQMISIDLSDKDFFVDATQNIAGRAIDLLIHSPGGSAEATESIVAHLRSRFDDIRVLIPGTAKSAATMMAMAGNQLIMDEISELGPTDPQMVINGRYSPAGAILKQFEKAQAELQSNPAKIGSWLPVLQQYGPSLLIECQNHLDLSKSLVKNWLTQYMFSGQDDADTRAEEIATWLAHDEYHLSHSRRIGFEELQRRGLNVLDMRTDAALYEAVRQLHLALMHTFQGTGAFKIVENSENITLARSIMVQAITPGAPGAPAAPAP